MITIISILIIDIAYQKEYIIYPKENTLTINNTIKQIDQEKVDNIIRMISSWKMEYKNDRVIDGEEFYIEIITDKDKTTIHGKGSYPNNYADFKTLLGEL